MQNRPSGFSSIIEEKKEEYSDDRQEYKREKMMKSTSVKVIPRGEADDLPMA